MLPSQQGEGRAGGGRVAVGASGRRCRGAASGWPVPSPASSLRHGQGPSLLVPPALSPQPGTVGAEHGNEPTQARPAPPEGSTNAWPEDGDGLLQPGCPPGTRCPSPADRRRGSGRCGAGGVILFFALVYTKTTYRYNKISHS